MAGLIKLNKDEFDALENMTVKEYGLFLEDKLEEAKQDDYFKRYKFITERQFYRFFTYPPFFEEEKYNESIDQRKERLRLKSAYRDAYVKETLNKDVKHYYLPIHESGLDANEVQQALGITRKTLYNIENSTNELRTYTEANKLYVDTQSLISYLENRHYESTNLGMEQMYLEVKELSFALTKREIESKRQKLNEIINSEEYKAKWEKYFKEVCDEQRVRIEPRQIRRDNVDIYIKSKEINNYFEVYNPNIKICDDKLKEIPKLYSVNYWAAILGVVTRTVLKYCELGVLKYYKVGSKYMISAEDFAESKNLIEDNKKKTKSNVGRKKKIETLFTEEIEHEYFLELIKGSDFYKELFDLYEDKKLLEKEINQTNKLIRKYKKEEAKGDSDSRKEKEKVEISLKKLKAALARVEKESKAEKRKAINEVFGNEYAIEALKDDITEYFSLVQSLKTYKRDKLKAAKAGDDKIVSQLSYIISEFEGKLKAKQSFILQKALKLKDE